MRPAVLALLLACTAACTLLEPMTGPGPVQRTASGLEWRDEVRPLKGAPAEAGMLVEIHYIASVRGAERFDSSYDRGQPLRFVLGAGEVPRALDEGLLGMLVGGRRTLVAPPELAFGAAGIPGSVPPDSFVIFDVELLKLERS